MEKEVDGGPSSNLLVPLFAKTFLSLWQHSGSVLRILVTTTSPELLLEHEKPVGLGKETLPYWFENRSHSETPS